MHTLSHWTKSSPLYTHPLTTTRYSLHFACVIDSASEMDFASEMDSAGEMDSANPVMRPVSVVLAQREARMGATLAGAGIVAVLLLSGPLHLHTDAVGRRGTPTLRRGLSH